MKSKNSKAITRPQEAHILRVKELSCAVCGEGGGHSSPSEGHHIQQGLHFTMIPLCADCHRGSHNGIHGEARIWTVMRKSELICLDETIARLYGR